MVQRLALAVSVAALLMACAATPATPTAQPTVTVAVAAADMAFDQTELVVPAGDPFAIDFENRDAVPHNISIRGVAGASGQVIAGPASQTYIFGPLAAGRYTFFCQVHPEMTGTLIVEAAP